jgi:hypothetical protein
MIIRGGGAVGRVAIGIPGLGAVLGAVGAAATGGRAATVGAAATGALTAAGG